MTKDLDEILSGIKALLMSAMKGSRSIQFEMNRPFFEKPSSGSIQEYETTGQIFIEIRTGLKGSSKYTGESEGESGR